MNGDYLVQGNRISCVIGRATSEWSALILLEGYNESLNHTPYLPQSHTYRLIFILCLDLLTGGILPVESYRWSLLVVDLSIYGV